MLTLACSAVDCSVNSKGPRPPMNPVQKSVMLQFSLVK